MTPQLKAALHDEADKLVSRVVSYGAQMSAQFPGIEPDKQVTDVFIEQMFELFQPEIERLVISARLKQTRRLFQHEKDVWGAVRDKDYFKAEIDMLKGQLTQQTQKEGKDE